MTPTIPPSKSAPVHLTLPPPARVRRDVGAVITLPDAPQLLPGVELETAKLWPDDRGYFSELFRFGQPGLARDFRDGVQVATALSYPGTIKAVHYHQCQTDLWAVVRGELQVMLVDLRTASPMLGQVNTLFVGTWRPWRLRIPPGVGHGYKVLGSEPVLLVYATDRFHDPGDEGRLPFDCPELNYDWGDRPR
ncbi:MAG: dTDP-4-dehydrorhamnose 3,5-epimerase family protein [Terriglobales bacterium]